MSVALLFPGQGAQVPGMLHALPAHPAVAATLAEAEVFLGRDPRSLDGEAALEATASVQLALLIAGVAVARALEAEGAAPDLVAGLSVGAFGAAVTAGTLSFPDALALVRLRGERMARACPQGHGMAAVIGLDAPRLSTLIDRVNGAGRPVFLAGVNAPRQIVIAGSDAALEEVLELARASGAHQATRLRVQVPSHCPLMAGVAEELTEAIATLHLRPPRLSYVGNRSARILQTCQAIGEDLATSVAHPVHWHDATTLLYERGARLFVELPPGRVLTDLASAAHPDARCLAVADGGFASALARVRGERTSDATS